MQQFRFATFNRNKNEVEFCSLFVSIWFDSTFCQTYEFLCDFLCAAEGRSAGPPNMSNDPQAELWVRVE